MLTALKILKQQLHLAVTSYYEEPYRFMQNERKIRTISDRTRQEFERPS